MRKAVYVYKGIQGLPAISKHTGIPFSCLSYRVHTLRMNIDQAVAEGPAKATGCKHIYKGVHGLKQIAKAHNFPVGTLESRVIQMGMSIEEALTKPIQHRACSGKAETKVDQLWKVALGIGGSHA